MKNTIDLRNKAAFSLVELSVVLVIVGLLVGGILAGISLRKGAELRSVTRDAHAYIAAIQQFRQQYSYLPGDFPQATKTWGRATSGAASAADCVTPATDAGTTSGSCNGDGNGTIDTNTTYEFLRAWQQLALSGFIPGIYTGVAATAAGVNEPTTVYQGSAFAFYNTHCAGICASDAEVFDGDYTNALYFGAFNATVTPTHTSGSGALLSGEEAYSIDQKFDDALPALGNIRAWKPALLASCASGSANTSATTYVVSGGSTATCALIFMSTYRSAKNGVE